MNQTQYLNGSYSEKKIAKNVNFYVERPIGSNFLSFQEILKIVVILRIYLLIGFYFNTCGIR